MSDNASDIDEDIDRQEYGLQTTDVVVSQRDPNYQSTLYEYLRMICFDEPQPDTLDEMSKIIFKELKEVTAGTRFFKLVQGTKIPRLINEDEAIESKTFNELRL